jgi:hypothetical protein
MKSLFKITSIATAVLFTFLFIQIFFMPGAFITDMGLTPDTASTVLIRRASLFMLGLALLMFISRNIPVSKARINLSISMSVIFFSLAINGISGYLYGNYNSSIFIAITLESILGVAFVLNIIIDGKSVKGQ